MLRRTLLVAGVALAFASEASAGCFATLGMNLPNDVGAGDTWTAKLEVRQHGQRLIPDAQPTVSIVNDETGERHRFDATSTGRAGFYTAKVVFPSNGTWRLSGNDGFNAPDGSWRCSTTHTFGSVSIGVPPPAASPPPAVPAPEPVAVAREDGGRTGLWIGLGTGLVALAALAAAVAFGRPRGRVARASNL